MWIDSHNHLHDPRLGDSQRRIEEMLRSGIQHAIVNATRQSDWQQVESLAQANPTLLSPAFGIHPWHAHTAQGDWLARLRELLEKYPRASIGECGIDQWIPLPPLAIQRRVFIDQLQLGRELDRPLTIHCLKAWGILMDCFKEAAPPTRFLMHSFSGSLETARRLLPLGAYFSFSGYFLQSRKAAVIEVFRQLPPDRILLESDAPDMAPPAEFITHPLPENHNHPANLPSIGHALAHALELTPEALAKTTRDNAKRLFDL
jgi:TatD DNase family protein